MKLDEAKQILNTNGFICEDAFRNNTDMDDIYAIIEAHGWNPDTVAKKIIEHYKNYIKSEKFYKTNFYKNPKENEWFNFDAEECIDELISTGEYYNIDLGLYNFFFYPAIKNNDKNSKRRTKLVIDDDVYNEMCNKLDAALARACEKYSESNKFFYISKDTDGIWMDEPYMFAGMDIEFKENVSDDIDKNTLVTELEKLINDIVMDKDLNKAEYDAVSYALDVEKEL
jgi:hypothetical protein